MATKEDIKDICVYMIIESYEMRLGRNLGRKERKTIEKLIVPYLESLESVEYMSYYSKRVLDCVKYDYSEEMSLEYLKKLLDKVFEAVKKISDEQKYAEELKNKLLEEVRNRKIEID